MRYNEAITYLEQNFTDDDEIAMMVLTENEVRSVAGDYYPADDLDKLLNLLSRLPTSHDIDHNYWYEQRGIFRKLVEAGVGAINRRKIEDDIRTKNNMLAEEMGLKNMVISLEHEVRPMYVVNPEEDFEVQQFGEKWFTLPKGSTYATLLRMLDKIKEGDGHHVFYEGSQVANIDGKIVLQVGFGS